LPLFARRRTTLLCAAAALAAVLALPAAVSAQTFGDVARAATQAALVERNTAIVQPLTPATAQPGLLGSTEFRSDRLDGLPQWTRVLDTMARERPTFERCAADVIECPTPALRNWHRIIAAAAQLPPDQQIGAINTAFNRWPYKEDTEVYGLQEYWATPSEFMAHSGDCEDYAIAKYFALRQLGFSKDAMRVVILKDRIRGVGHAVLAIYRQDRILILDSLSNMILPDDRYKHYVPQYSMNETTRWAHVGGFDQQPKTPYKGLYARNN
jgi:predicted transglutaminase-like cysteine proteinase